MRITALVLFVVLPGPASLAATPDQAASHYSRASALAAKGELDAAIDEYHQALGLRPDFAKAHKDLAATLEQKGDQEQALAEYREALRLKADDAEAHHRIADILRG